jgi:hypothetical protein
VEAATCSSSTAAAALHSSSSTFLPNTTPFVRSIRSFLSGGGETQQFIIF